MGDRVRDRDASVDVQHVAFWYCVTLAKSLLDMGVIGYQYILLIAEMKA